MSWSRDQVQELINLYREKQVLYFVKDIEYRNKHARNRALNEIEQRMKEIRPMTTVNEIKIKINALRSNFLHEHRKWQASKKSGAGLDDIQTPSLWYYKDMMFLLDHVAPRKSTDSMMSERDGNESLGEDMMDSDVVGEPSGICSSIESEYTPEPDENEDPLLGPSRPSSADSVVLVTPTVRRAGKSHDLLHTAVGAISEITTTLRKKTNNDPSPKEGEDVFGEFVASKLKLIRNKELKNKTERGICDILYSALNE